MQVEKTKLITKEIKQEKLAEQKQKSSNNKQQSTRIQSPSTNKVVTEDYGGPQCAGLKYFTDPSRLSNPPDGGAVTPHCAVSKLSAQPSAQNTSASVTRSKLHPKVLKTARQTTKETIPIIITKICIKALSSDPELKAN
jgi:hypothetical protein